MNLNCNSKVLDYLVDISRLSEDFILDIRYATENNFLGKKVYPRPLCALQKETAIKLINANKKFIGMGYCIKIFDGYRPISIQKIFWEIMPNDDFIANPYKNGSIHNRGCAVDITLVDINTGEELEMPSEFDDFSERANRNNPNMTKAAKRNLNILTEVMIENGFDKINSEWWHFTDCNKQNYQLIDIPFENIE